ncbi:MAG: hypothetical protein HY702_03010, partial [Gemmatimonadetes bacterium]|nr:hypothetical protein [Gemmatimonadota bacterium]
MSPILHALSPKLRIALRGLVRRNLEGSRALGVALLGVLFWVTAYGILYRTLAYFQGVEGLGSLLAEKLLGLALVTFLGILLLSNVIAGLSTFFLARDLDIFLAAPTERVHLYGARLGETLVHSSWMVALMAVPLLVAYERVFHGGPVFYALALLSLVPFLVIPAVAGSAAILGLVNLFPARRTREILGVITVSAAGGVILLVRLLRPERLVYPETFRGLGEFLALLRTPTSPWLPSEWVTDTLMGHLGGRLDPFGLLLLWSTAAGLVVLGAFCHDRLYVRGFNRSQEGAERYATSRTLGRWARRLLRALGPDRTELILKDVRAFFRDATQWSQLILLGVLVLVYVYNIRVLPLWRGEGVTVFLIHLVAFLNLGLAGFVLAAIAARFLFPALSLEGPTMWLLRSSPLRLRNLLWAKYWVGTAPLLLLAVMLTGITNVLLKVSPLLMAVSMVTIVALTFALSALALAAGAVYPQFHAENPAQIPTSFGGMVFMMAAVVLLGAVVTLEGWPFLAVLRHRLAAGAAGAG